MQPKVLLVQMNNKPDTQPLVDRTLSAWSVYDVPLYGQEAAWTRHLVGFARETCAGQVSSPLQTFDLATGLGVTRSGRVYRLNGRPGLDADARYVWAVWKRRNGIDDERDVTNQVIEEMERAALVNELSIGGRSTTEN